MSIEERAEKIVEDSRGPVYIPPSVRKRLIDAIVALATPPKDHVRDSTGRDWPDASPRRGDVLLLPAHPNEKGTAHGE